MDGRAAWAEDGLAGGAGGGDRPACSPPAASSTSPATSRSTPAPTCVAFARTDAAGEPVLVTSCPRRRAAPGAVELPPGRWRHVLLDDEPEAEGTLAVDAPLAAFPAIVLRRA